jgi:hypothetical protein
MFILIEILEYTNQKLLSSLIAQKPKGVDSRLTAAPIRRSDGQTNQRAGCTAAAEVDYGVRGGPHNFLIIFR